MRTHSWRHLHSLEIGAELLHWEASGHSGASFAGLNLCQQSSKTTEPGVTNRPSRKPASSWFSKINGETFATSSCSNNWPSATLNQRAFPTLWAEPLILNLKDCATSLKIPLGTPALTRSSQIPVTPAWHAVLWITRVLPGDRYSAAPRPGSRPARRPSGAVVRPAPDINTKHLCNCPIGAPRSQMICGEATCLQHRDSSLWGAD